MTSSFSLALVVFFFVSSLTAKTLPRMLEPTQLPSGCLLEKIFPCAVQTEVGLRWELKSSTYRIVIHEKSTLLLMSSDEIRLVRGIAWVDANSPMTMKSVYGEIVGVGQFWVRYSSSYVSVGVHSGRAHLFPRDGRESLTVAVGMVNWMGKINARGRSQVGIPQTVILHDHMEYWTRLNEVSLARFENEARMFVHRWVESAQKSSLRQKFMANRYMASVKTNRARRKERRDRLNAKEAEMRNLFRKRNYFN